MRVLVLVLALLCATGAQASTLAQLDSWDSAVILALELSPELLPPPDLVAALRADLTAIHTYDTFFTQFSAVPDCVPGCLMVRLTDPAWSEYLAGQYHGLDGRNQQYGPVHISVLSPPIKLLILYFDQPYNPPALASLYAGAAGVEYAVPSHITGREKDIACATLGRYVYSWGWGDCMCGCLNEHFWEFQVTGGTATLLRSWGSDIRVTTRPTSWGQLKVNYR